MKREKKEQDSELEDLYLDANVFIYSILDDSFVGNNARRILEKIENGVYQGFTSVLTVDEVLWKIQKVVGKEKAAGIARDFLGLANLEFVPADNSVITKALEIYMSEKLDPRDSIHLACMQIKKLKVIASSDIDFDRVKWIRRIDFSK
ncbi:type II toxin-antitoxin system VapC family toxin [Candidatus Pacearchaeota archaeon]|nr:type II toxin-antitoxin system VapC family toxin [Candidatus Pacearchaeota archaeon]